MKNSMKLRVFLMVGLLGIGFASSVQAGWIYSNSVNDLGVRFNPGTLEVGDQIKFAPGIERNVTYFDFEYWGLNSASQYLFSGNVQARVRFYLNDGAPFNGYPTPSTILYDSGWFGGFPTTETLYQGRATLTFSTPADFPSTGLTVPDEITWSVQFQGMSSTDTVGLDLYSPPTLGQNYPDYWEFSSGSWSLRTNTVPMDFGARFYAIPEPSSLVLSLAGGMGILMLVRRLRRAE